MPPTVAVPRDHGSTIQGRGNTIVAIIISVILAMVAVGWLIYCWYTRHVGIGDMVGQAHARMARGCPHSAQDAEAGHEYVGVYTPRYTDSGWMRAKRKRRHPIIEEPRRVWIHRVPADGGRYRVVRRVTPPHQEIVNVLPDNSPPTKKQKKNQSQQQQQSKQNQNFQQHHQQQNQNKGKKKQKDKKNNQHNNQQDNQHDPTNVQAWQSHQEHPDNWGHPAWNNQNQVDQGQAEQDACGQPAWSDQNQGDQGQVDAWSNARVSWNNQPEQNQVNSPRSQYGRSQNGRRGGNHSQGHYGRRSSRKKSNKRNAKDAIHDQLGYNDEPRHSWVDQPQQPEW